MTEPTFNGETLPRDVSRYEPCSHFMQRLKYRTDPEPSKAIVKEVVEEGRLLNTHLPDRVIFEREIGWHTWRVLAAVNTDAFERETATHYLLTVYADGVHDEDHREVFDEVGT